jgi:regulator of replication initiation timing
MSAGNGRSELCDYEHEMSILTQLDGAERTIEALQQEIEQLKEFCKDTKWYLENKHLLVKENKHLKQQIQQLQAQNGEKNDAISKAVEFINAGLYCDDEERNCEAECDKRFGDCLLEVLKAAFSETPDYHNPADVEALTKARGAFEGIIKTYEDDFAIEGLEGLCPREDAILNYYTRPALSAIEKAGGEK